MSKLVINVLFVQIPLLKCGEQRKVSFVLSSWDWKPLWLVRCFFSISDCMIICLAVGLITIKRGVVSEWGGCGHTLRGWSHLPVRWPVSSRSAAVWSGRSRLCCPSAGSPPGGAMECSSAGHAPSCSEPETMTTAQRHHLYVSSR